MNCKKCKNMFVEAAYGDFEPEQQQAFEQHLASCQPCATAFREMQATLQVMAQREKAPANTEFLDSLWAQINPEIDQQPSSTRTGKLPHLAPFLQSKWLFGLTAAAALFALGIFVGRLVFSTAPPAEEFAQRHSGAVSEAHYQQIEQRSARYLERSKVLLLGIINHEPVEADSGILNLDYKKSCRSNW